MNRSFPALLVGVCLTFPFALTAQTAPVAKPATPALPSAPVATQKPTAPPQGSGVVTTLKAQSNLVVVDVVVRDKNHQPVHGLKAADFQVKEAGVTQTVKSVEEHVPSTVAVDPKTTAMPSGVFTNYTAVPNNGPVNVLLIDRLNTPVDAQMYLHNQLVQFLKTMKPGTQVAVFGLNTQLVYLQGVTSDPKVLLAALESKKGGARQSPLAAGAQDTATSDAMTDAGASEAAIANVMQFEAEQASFRKELQVKYTLDAMNVLAHYLTSIPGRKNLIWFSGSFPLTILPDGDLKDPFATVTDMQDIFRETTNALSKAQVAVYPVDARGIQTFMNAQDSGSKTVKSPGSQTRTPRTPSMDVSVDQMTMQQMASETGGEAYVNTNALAEAVDKAIENGSSYYTITYTPTEVKTDGSFRKIQVSTTTPGADLAYRRGYYSEGAARKQLTASTLAPAATAEQMAAKNAMVRGTPTPTELLFKVFVAPLGPPTEATVAKGNVMAPETSKGPYRNYTVNYAVSPQDMGFKNIGDGKYELALQFLVWVYDQNGLKVNAVGNIVTAAVTVDNVKAMLQNGLQFHQTVSVPANGEYFLRVGIRDQLVDHVGAVEVPIDSVKKLAVVEAPVVKPAPPKLSDLPK